MMTRDMTLQIAAMAMMVLRGSVGATDRDAQNEAAEIAVAHLRSLRAALVDGSILAANVDWTIGLLTEKRGADWIELTKALLDNMADELFVRWTTARDRLMPHGVGHTRSMRGHGVHHCCVLKPRWH